MNDSSAAPCDEIAADGGDRNRWWLALALAAVTVGVFWQAARNDFVNLDDTDYFTANPVVQRGLTKEGIAWGLQPSHAGNWHPVTWLSHMLDAEWFGVKPAGPHAVNVLLHGFNAALLLALLSQLTGSRWRSLMVAAFFALHPMHVESVAWISERKDVLSACFGLLTLLAYARYVTGAPPSALRPPRSQPSSIPHLPSSPWYWLALSWFALGLMSKPMLVTWPFVLLLLDFWPLKRVSSWKLLILEKIPFLAFAIVSCVLTILAQRRGGAVHTLADTSLLARMENAVVAYGCYLGKTFWPVKLAVPYPHPGHWPLIVVFGSIGILSALTFVLWLARKRIPAGWMGWLWFVGTLVPVIGLVQVGAQFMADRYHYLPSIGLFIAVVWVVGELSAKWRGKSGTALPPGPHDDMVSSDGRNSKRELKTVQWPLLAAGLVIASVLGWRATQQIKVWRNSETLFAHAIRVTQRNYIAHYNLGHFYDLAGRREEAREHYELALKIRPYYPEANNNLGALLAGQREYAAAIDRFRTALASRTNDVAFRNNLGRALVLGGRDLVAQGKPVEALTWLTEAVQTTPESYEAQNGLGTALAMTGHMAESVVHFQQALKIKPDSVASHMNLSRAFMALGETNVANLHQQEAARLTQLNRQK